MVRYCEDKLVDEHGDKQEDITCPGHLSKFDDCVQEALWELVLDNGGELQTGTDDFEGTFTLFNFADEEAVEINPDGVDARWVMVPEGYYILQTTSGGFVYTLKYETYREAREAYEVADDRYSRWEKGCEQTGHEVCETEDECQLGGIPA